MEPVATISIDEGVIYVIMFFICYAIAFAFFFIALTRRDMRYLRKDNERDLKYLKDDMDRDLERLKRENLELRQEIYKIKKT